jgi:hypothetical protein
MCCSATHPCGFGQGCVSARGKRICVPFFTSDACLHALDDALVTVTDTAVGGGLMFTATLPCVYAVMHGSVKVTGESHLWLTSCSRQWWW